MINDSIKQSINDAMKAGDEVRVSTLRMLSSELHNEKINKKGKLTEKEELKVVQKEVKKRKDAIEVLRQAQDKLTEEQDQSVSKKIKQEEKELEILQEFLPEQLSDEELNDLVQKAIKETGAESMSDMGKVIGNVMSKAGNRVEGGRVAETAKMMLINANNTNDAN